MTRAEQIERLRAAEKPSRMLDVRVLMACEVPYNSVPRLTSSMEATIALINQVLPGWMWKVGTCCVSDDAWLSPDFNCPIHGERLKAELGYDRIKAGDPLDTGVDIDLRPPGRPAIALCIALLEALDLRDAAKSTALQETGE